METAAATTFAGPSIETIESLLDVTYTWGYQDTREKLRDLYDKAVRAQWISDDVLPWKTDVDLSTPMGPEQLMPLVDSVGDLDSKLYAASQVVDEARHVDVYNRYLNQKVGFSYPVNPHLKTLLDMILKDSRWDMKFLGMQIMVEGLALAAFGMIRNN